MFKSKDKTDISNYRPIALLPVISKIFERVYLARMRKFIEKSKILFNKQFGFRPNSSTTSAIFDFIESIIEALDGKDHVTSLLCDLSKAFDCVDHQIVLEILKRYGIRGIPLAWLTLFLSTQRVHIDNASFRK